MGFFSNLFGSKKKGTKKIIKIKGMICANCTNHVKKTLLEINGVNDVDMDLMNGTATVYVEDFVPDELLEAAIKDAGYTFISVSAA